MAQQGSAVGIGAAHIRQAETVDELVTVGQRFGKMPSGVEKDNRESLIDRGRHVQENRTLGTE